MSKLSHSNPYLDNVIGMDSSSLKKAYERHADACRSEGMEPCTYGEFVCNPHEYEYAG